MSPEEKEMIQHMSFYNYFKVDWQDKKCIITDHYRMKPFYQRQRMLATVYDRIGQEERSNLTVHDLDGSNGYYSFLAETFGFKELTVSDAREIHQKQFEFIKKRILPSSKIQFKLMDISDKVTGEYDLLLVQGLLYHLYDHLRFMHDLYNCTRKYLILETAMSGRFGFVNLTEIEDVSNNPRTGTQGLSIYPSYATVLALLYNVGFKNICRIQPPKGVADNDGYKTGYRVMLFCTK